LFALFIADSCLPILQDTTWSAIQKPAAIEQPNMQLTANSSKTTAITAVDSSIAAADQKPYPKHAAESPTTASMQGSQESSSSPAGQNHVFMVFAHHMHYLTFLPLIIIGVLQDINVVLAAVICVCIVCFLLLTGFFLKRGGYIKVRSTHALMASLSGVWMWLVDSYHQF
jgi:hypothetical protein